MFPKLEIAIKCMACRDSNQIHFYKNRIMEVQQIKLSKNKIFTKSTVFNLLRIRVANKETQV